jgi:single-stranded DNA-binding protein
MIDGLIGGTLHGGQTGNTFVTAKVRAIGGDRETLFVNVIAFSQTVQNALLAMGDGNSVALAGTLTPKVWTDRNAQARLALDMVTHSVLTAYHVQRRHKAVHREGRDANDGVHDGMDDDLCGVRHRKAHATAPGHPGPAADIRGAVPMAFQGPVPECH